jgi:alkaline phosphatase D
VVDRLTLGACALLLLTVTPGGLGPAATVPDGAGDPVLVTVGEVTPGRGTLWLRSEGATPVTVRWAAADGSGETRTVAVRPAPSADHTARVSLAPLRPATRYGYEVRRGQETVSGHFVSAPAPDQDAPVRLVWGGDLGGRGHCRHPEDGYRIFQAMARRGADLFLFVGDTVYADHPCGGPGQVPGADFVATRLPEYHARHRYNRADPALQRFFRGTAVYAIWDDHEVRDDFAGPSEPLMPVARQAFLDYWPIEEGEPGRLYRRLRWGRHVEIFILDTRQYRSANDVRDGPGKSMLGAAQRAWLLDRVAASDATWKLVVSSVPLGMFTGGGPADGWSSANVLGFPRRGGQGFAHERDAILGELRAGGVKNLVFVGGEVHHAELVRHEPFPGWVFHEFVAGPLAAHTGFPRPLDRSLRSRSLGSLGWTHNFGEIVADAEELRVSILDVAGTTRVALRLAADPDPPGGRR